MGSTESYKLYFHLVFVLAALLIISGQAVAGIDVQVDPDPLQTIVQNEISLTLVPGALPGQPTVLLAAYNDDPFLGGPGLGYSFSTNGGTSWTSGQLAAPMNTTTGLSMDNSFDPATTADSFGNLYIGHIAWDSLGYSAMVIRSSTNNGATWSAETLLALDVPAAGVPDPTFRLNDRAQIAADTVASSPYLGTVHAAWIKDRGNDPSLLPFSDIYVSHSINTNPATIFSPDQRINDVGISHDLANMPVPSVAADGTVYVSWLDYNVTIGGQGTIYLDKSTDGGVTWGADITVSTIDLPPLSVTTQNPTPATDARAKGAPVLATHPTNPNELYIVYAADPDGIAIGPDEGDIFLIKSTNQGVTWSAPVRVNDDTTDHDQILPWVEVKPDGTIDIAWYDRRNDGLDEKWDVYITKSTDGGASFLPNVLLNDIAFLTPQPGVPWMGEYLGLAVDSDYAYVAWTTTATGDSNGDIFFDKIPNSVIPEPTVLTLLAVGAVALLRRKK